jgi:HipA-like protein
MTNELVALLDGREIGSVHYKNSRLSFVYRESWRADPEAYPLSLSMPLGSAEHVTRASRLFSGVCCRTMTGFLRIGEDASRYRQGTSFD